MAVNNPKFKLLKVKQEVSQILNFGSECAQAGRITASHFKSAYCTDQVSPFFSLIMLICHPELSRFRNAALCLGCEHEDTARQKYFAISKQKHEKLKISEPVLFISTKYHIGTSPDGMACNNGIW